MLLLSERLKDTPIMSLQTGSELARTGDAIIDPGVLDIIAYRVSGNRLEHDKTILLTRDIRELGNLGIIIDSTDELVPLEDIIKIKELAELQFQLYDLEVIDTTKKKLGRIYEYAFDVHTFTIHQIFVKRPILKSLQTRELIINRSQIVEINNSSIIVDAATIDEKPQPAILAENFVNPFRKPSAPSGTASSQET